MRSKIIEEDKDKVKIEVSNDSEEVLSPQTVISLLIEDSFSIGKLLLNPGKLGPKESKVFVFSNINFVPKQEETKEAENEQRPKSRKSK